MYQKKLLIAGAFPLSWLTAFSVWQCEPAPGESRLQCQITGSLMGSLFMFMQTLCDQYVNLFFLGKIAQLKQ